MTQLPGQRRQTPPSRSASDEKVRLRSVYAPMWLAIPPERARSAGQLAGRRLEEWPEFARKDELAAFSSLPGEVDSAAFFELAFANQKELLLPRIVEDRLEFAPVARGEELRRGRFGVYEPPAERSARQIGSGAIVLIPGVAFDRRGGRLGRGAGYYDRALAAIRSACTETTFIGVGFQAQIIERVPMEPHDIRMDGVLTESALFWVEDKDSRG